MREAIGNAGLVAVISIGLSAAFPVIAWVTPVLPAGISISSQGLAGMAAGKVRPAVGQYVNGLTGQKVILNTNGQDAETMAGELGFHWSNTDTVDQAASQYTGDNLVRQYMVQKGLVSVPMDLKLDTEVDSAKVRESVDTWCQVVITQPQDTTITRESGQSITTDSVTDEVVDAAAAEAALNKALEGELEEPVKVTAEMAEQQLAVIIEALATIQDVLGTYTTDFNSNSAARSTDLAVGAAKTNGHLLMPEEVLSGYEYLQPSTATSGYKTAAAYENGQVVNSIGGGVYQLVTTLYSASPEAEVEIVQRQDHFMIVTYVKPSRDAAIASTYKDIKIKNNYNTPIYVEGYIEGRKLILIIYGREICPENHKVRYVSKTLGSASPEGPQLIIDNALTPGTKVEVQFSHTGPRSRLWEVVTVGGVEQERTLLSKGTYNAFEAICRVGPALPADIPPDPNAAVPVETALVETALVTGADGGPGVTQPAPIEAAPDPTPADPAPVQADPTPTEAVPDSAPVVAPVSGAAG